MAGKPRFYTKFNTACRKTAQQIKSKNSNLDFLNQCSNSRSLDNHQNLITRSSS